MSMAPPAKLAAGRATPPDMKALEAAVADGRRAVGDGDLALFAQSDDAFHQALAEASHNIFLIDAVAHIRAVQGQVSFLELGRNTSHADRAVKEHNLIVDALRSGEALLAAERA